MDCSAMMGAMTDVLSRFIRDAGELPAGLPPDAPWQILGRIGELVLGLLDSLPPEFVRLSAGQAVHRSATVASSAVLGGPVILSAGCRVGHGAILRGGVWAGEEVTIGPHAEIKGSLLFARSAAAHRNYAGDSIIGRDVNLEAGAVLANHFNERTDKHISVWLDGQEVATGADQVRRADRRRQPHRRQRSHEPGHATAAGQRRSAAWPGRPVPPRRRVLTAGCRARPASPAVP
jgi:carbonic anhydrase/acetyltransferase-like protein (isoleucine patch superfamily)